MSILALLVVVKYVRAMRQRLPLQNNLICHAMRSQAIAPAPTLLFPSGHSRTASIGAITILNSARRTPSARRSCDKFPVGLFRQSKAIGLIRQRQDCWVSLVGLKSMLMMPLQKLWRGSEFLGQVDRLIVDLAKRGRNQQVR